MIHDSGYLAGIVSDESHSRCRVYIFKLVAEEIIAVSNPVGDLGEVGMPRLWKVKTCFMQELKMTKETVPFGIRCVLTKKESLFLQENR